MLASKYVRGGNRRPERISRTDRVAGGGIRVIPMRATPPAMSCDYPTKGTPQGGILSNIVLNELDWWVASQWENMPTHYEYKTRQNFSCAIK